jgi:hypothetical protein
MPLSEAEVNERIRVNPARANELESIFYSKIIDIQENLNRLIRLVKQSRESGVSNAWNTMINKYPKLCEIDGSVRIMSEALDYDLNSPLGNEPWRNCGDG